MSLEDEFLSAAELAGAQSNRENGPPLLLRQHMLRDTQ
jgi:hypothetical protein